MAGGNGRRFGALKQFLDLAGRPVLSWSVEAARTIADGVVVVVPGVDGAEGAGGSTATATATANTRAQTANTQRRGRAATAPKRSAADDPAWFSPVATR